MPSGQVTVILAMWLKEYSQPTLDFDSLGLSRAGPKCFWQKGKLVSFLNSPNAQDFDPALYTGVFIGHRKSPS